MAPELPKALAAANPIGFLGNVYLRTHTNTNATPFYNFLGNGGAVDILAITLPGASYNAGFTLRASGENDIYAINMPLGTGLRNICKKDWSYSTRASTYSTNGSALMIVSVP